MDALLDKTVLVTANPQTLWVQRTKSPHHPVAGGLRLFDERLLSDLDFLTIYTSRINIVSMV